MRTIQTHRISARGGFSLTELMIVITVMGLMLAIGAPAMGRYLQSWRLNGEANEMATFLRLARTAAVSKNTGVVFVFDASAGEYYYFEDDDASGVANAGEYQSALQEMPDGIHIDSYSMAQQWITFGPKGNTIDGGSIILKNSHETTKRVRIFSGTGTVTVD
jgi:prepilin-type N-terminal cleavage/methylation domain-containing protein